MAERMACRSHSIHHLIRMALIKFAKANESCTCGNEGRSICCSIGSYSFRPRAVNMLWMSSGDRHKVLADRQATQTPRATQGCGSVRPFGTVLPETI